MSTIGVVLGSIREGRSGTAVAEWVMDLAKGREHTYELIDLKTFDVPLLTAGPTPPAAMKREYPDERVTAWSKAIDACAAFIFVTAEYNHGTPGAFKNAVDWLGPEWHGKPVGFVSYGAEGGVRAVEQWRQVIANFSMVAVREQVALRLMEEFKDGALLPHDRRGGEIEGLFKAVESALALS